MKRITTKEMQGKVFNELFKALRSKLAVYGNREYKLEKEVCDDGDLKLVVLPGGKRTFMCGTPAEDVFDVIKDFKNEYPCDVINIIDIRTIWDEDVLVPVIVIYVCFKKSE